MCCWGWARGKVCADSTYGIVITLYHKWTGINYGNKLYELYSIKGWDKWIIREITINLIEWIDHNVLSESVISSSKRKPVKWFQPSWYIVNPGVMPPISHQIWSPACKLSVDCKEYVSYWAPFEVSSEQLPPIRMPFNTIWMSPEILVEDGWILPSPDAEKKYFPLRGAVNLPVCKFMAPPTFSRAVSNFMGTLDTLNGELNIWT